MRWFLLICLALAIGPVWSLPIVGKPVVSPKSPQIMAKIAKTTNGRQLFISYDKGRTWERITWFGSTGQVIDFSWSQIGLLSIVADNIPTDYEVGNDFKHSPTDPSSIGVYDTVTKIIYWLGGFYAKPVGGVDDITGVKWVRPDTITYKLTRSYVQIESEVYQKTVKITPLALKSVYQDYAPWLVHFGWQIIAAVKENKNPETILIQAKVKITPEIRKYFANKQNRQNMARYFEATIVQYDDICTRLRNSETIVLLFPSPAKSAETRKQQIEVIGCSFLLNQKQKTLIGEIEYVGG